MASEACAMARFAVCPNADIRTLQNAASLTVVFACFFNDCISLPSHALAITPHPAANSLDMFLASVGITSSMACRN